MVRWIFVSGIEVSICMTAILGVKKVEFLWSQFCFGQGEDWLSAWPSMMEDNLTINLSDPGLSNQSILYYSIQTSLKLSPNYTRILRFFRKLLGIPLGT